jgi:hypothetical protein
MVYTEICSENVRRSRRVCSAPAQNAFKSIYVSLRTYTEICSVQDLSAPLLRRMHSQVSTFYWRHTLKFAARKSDVQDVFAPLLRRIDSLQVSTFYWRHTLKFAAKMSDVQDVFAPLLRRMHSKVSTPRPKRVSPMPCQGVFACVWVHVYVRVRGWVKCKQQHPVEFIQ